MKPSKGYYSLIQFCPDHGRMETANAGLVLLCPERKFLEARVIHSYQRLKKIVESGDFDGKAVNAAKDAIAYRINHSGDEIRTEQDLIHFAQTRANDFLLTLPRPTAVSDPKADFERLFGKLVGDESETRKQEEESDPPVIRNFKQTFSRLEAKGKVRSDIEVPVPTSGRTLRANYAYCNGTHNFVMSKIFPSRGEGHAVIQAEQLGAEGHLISAEPASDGKQQKLFVVPALDGDGSAILKKVENILEKLGVEVVRDVDGFARKVESEAH